MYYYRQARSDVADECAGSMLQPTSGNLVDGGGAVDVAQREESTESFGQIAGSAEYAPTAAKKQQTG